MFKGNEWIEVYERNLNVDYETHIKQKVTIRNFVNKFLNNNEYIKKFKGSENEVKLPELLYKIKTLNIITKKYQEFVSIEGVKKEEIKFLYKITAGKIDLYVSKNQKILANKNNELLILKANQLKKGYQLITQFKTIPIDNIEKIDYDRIWLFNNFI